MATSLLLTFGGFFEWIRLHSTVSMLPINLVVLCLYHTYLWFTVYTALYHGYTALDHGYAASYFQQA